MMQHEGGYGIEINPKLANGCKELGFCQFYWQIKYV